MTNKLILAACACVLFAGCADVNAGYRGVVINWNKPTGEVKGEGIYPLIPGSGYDIIAMNVQTVNREIETIAASKDLQTVHTKVTVNYHVDPAKVVSVYDRLRKDYEQRVLDPTVHEAVKASTARFIANDLIAKRDQVRSAIDQDLRSQMTPYGIVVEQVLITNFAFDQQFQDAVEKKVAAQQAQITASIESTTKYNQAVIDNKTAIANAQAEATANRLKQQTLTPLLLRKAAIDKWDGKMPQVQGANTPLIKLGD